MVIQRNTSSWHTDNNDAEQQAQMLVNHVESQQVALNHHLQQQAGQIIFETPPAPAPLPPPPIPNSLQPPRQAPMSTARPINKSTFSMRQVTLSNMASASQGSRHRPHLARAREGMSVTKSLDLLRQNIQAAINKDLDGIKFFQPAVDNLRSNLGAQAVSEEHVKAVCRNILEEAKHLYAAVPQSRSSSPPPEFSDSETGSIGRAFCQSPLFRKRKESDTDSEASQSIRRKRGRGRGGSAGMSGRCTPLRLPRVEPVRREAPKWDPARITKETLFVMGAKANKALGFGLTRGRLYIKHPELFRYSGDQEDKEWLVRHSLMPPTGGKAYLMIVEDVSDLSETDEYRHSQNLQLHELKGFEAPEFMLHKIRGFMHHMRTDLPGGHRRHCHNSPGLPELLDSSSVEAECLSSGMIPTATIIDSRFRDESSGPPTPSDALELLENTASQSSSSPFLGGGVVGVASPHSSLAVMWGSGVQDTSQEPL
ncbi:hypothetical protein B566_EDAN015163 [Ephemera danica]|nr:hypothetical protein B566_EDAN015163 [Ephemera danica]